MTDQLTLNDLPQPEWEGTVSPDDLHVDGENPNEQSDDMFGLLCENLRRKGWVGNAIVTDTDGLIADGEHRWRAAQEIGLEEIPVKQYDLNDAERRLWRQELNKISGEHDTKRDALEYDYLLNSGRTDDVHALTNAAEEDLDELLAEIKLTNEQHVPYEYDPDHNVYFEDCVEGLGRLADDSVDCIITDPPYGVDFVSGHREEQFDGIANDEDEASALDLFASTLPELQRVLKPSGHAYVFTSWRVYSQFHQLLSGAFEIQNCLVWAKNNWGMGHVGHDFRPQHEFIIFAHGDSPRPLSEQESDLLKYARPHSVDYDHPTQKPVSLVERLLSLSTDEEDTVCDPFMGSGTTAVAAIQNNRDYVGFELDEENYRSVIERRISEAKRQVESNANQEAEADD